MRHRTIIAGFCVVAALCVSPPAYASATGCTGNPGSNGSKCIDVKGTKLHVDTVKTTLTKNHADDCGKATITIGSSWKRTSAKICEARDFSWGPITVNKSFPDGTKACASWSNYPDGKACITIHD
ncbi:hypothetical protein [Streptomyces sp. STR69]|uniref:hypothetical protein n=1 Tax=Streptomyces sp. STR69 TaxID=1796942 RepID=UPI0021C9E453|nr:hypothetical protein [Streptomyces sp. STR69]